MRVGCGISIDPSPSRAGAADDHRLWSRVASRIESPFHTQGSSGARARVCVWGRLRNFIIQRVCADFFGVSWPAWLERETLSGRLPLGSPRFEFGTMQARFIHLACFCVGHSVTDARTELLFG